MYRCHLVSFFQNRVHSFRLIVAFVDTILEKLSVFQLFSGKLLSKSKITHVFLS